MESLARSTDPVAAKLVNALSSDIPTKEMRELIESLPLNIVQAVLADAAVVEHTATFAFSALENPGVTDHSKLNNFIQGLNSSDAAAAERLQHALSDGPLAKNMRTLLQSLPLHIVQAVLGKNSLVNDVPEIVTTISDPPEVASDSVDTENFRLDGVQKVSISSNEARAALLEKALKVNLPINIIDLLKLSLPLRIVENELSQFGRIRVGLASATAVNDPDAKEIFMLAMAAELPSRVLRPIVNALPLHVVQSELSRGVLVPCALPLSKL